MLACSKLGAYFTLFNYAYTTAEFVNALRATTPKVLLANLTTSKYDYTSVFEELRQQAPELERIILLQDTARPGKVDASGSDAFMTFEELLDRGAHANVRVSDLESKIVDTEILNLQFTSGSTGLPKVAALTHHGMLNSSRYIGLKMKIKPSDSIIVPVPLFHAFGLVIGKNPFIVSPYYFLTWNLGFCTALIYGASIVLPSEYFDTCATLDAIEKYQATGLFGVTTMFVDMLSHQRFESTRRSSLRYVFSVSHAEYPVLAERLIKL